MLGLWCALMTDMIYSSSKACQCKLCTKTIVKLPVLCYCLKATHWGRHKVERTVIDKVIYLFFFFNFYFVALRSKHAEGVVSETRQPEGKGLVWGHALKAVLKGQL